MTLKLYVLSIYNIDLKMIYKTISKLPFALHEKICHFHFRHDQLRVILSELLIRKILSEELSISLDSVKIERDTYGKPFLQTKDRYFNLSHSKDIIVLVTDDISIGVDVECVEPLDDLKEIVKICLSNEEQKNFISTEPNKQLDYFYETWTLKESYIKAIGKGLCLPLNSFSIKFSEENGYFFISDKQVIWFFKQYSVVSQYKCSVCAQHQHFPVAVCHLSYHDLLNMY